MITVVVYVRVRYQSDYVKDWLQVAWTVTQRKVVTLVRQYFLSSDLSDLSS